MPLATELALIASAMLLLMMCRMPSAASVTDRPSGFASCVSIGLVREVGVDREVAAEELVGVEAPEHDLRVGDGRLRRRRWP